MQKKVIDFLKNKFNIALIVLQVFAIISYFLMSILFFMILFFLLESAFFILWGIKILIKNKHYVSELEINNQLPYTDEQKQQIRKTSESNMKNNKIMSVMLILFGIILFISSFSIIF